jgi:hypothetical protein
MARRTGVAFAAVVVGLIVALAAGEIGLRALMPQMTGPIQFAFDAELGAIPVPNQRARRTLPGVYDYRYSNNSVGLRGGREFAAGPLAGQHRILVLGDSFAYGIGVDDDQTFASVLESRLNKQGEAVEVINAGNGGKGTDYALKFFATQGRRLRPELALLFFFYNDFDDNVREEYYLMAADGGLRPQPLAGSEANRKSVLAAVPFYNWLISWSHLANLVKKTAIGLLSAADSGDAAATGPRLVTEYIRGRGPLGTRHRMLTVAYVRELARLAGESGTDLLAFYVPAAEDVELLRSGRAVSEEQRVFTEIMRESSVCAIALTDALAASPLALPDLYYVEGHWTAAGHEVAAEAVRGRVTGYFDEPARPGCRS